MTFYPVGFYEYHLPLPPHTADLVSKTPSTLDASRKMLHLDIFFKYTNCILMIESKSQWVGRRGGGERKNISGNNLQRLRRQYACSFEIAGTINLELFQHSVVHFPSTLIQYRCTLPNNRFGCSLVSSGFDDYFRKLT